MIVDASALVAVMLGERGSEQLLFRLLETRRRMTHPVSVYEAALAVSRVKKKEPAFGLREVEMFCDETGIDLVDLGERETAAALDAFSRYGKGRHPAGLNMGDCFSYACARTRGLPLLYKGDDFAKTDLASA